LFAILHGRQELGFVDELTFMGKQAGSRVLLLGGRAWRVTHVDWQRKVAHVEVSEDRGRTRWKGQGQGLSFRLCRAIQRVLAGDGTRPWWSQRALDRFGEIRGEYAWLRPEGSVVIVSPDSGTEWWTFAGYRTNASLAPSLAQITHKTTSHDSLTVRFDQPLLPDELDRIMHQLRLLKASDLSLVIEPAAVEGLKFSECLPPDLASHILQMRTRDPIGVSDLLREPIRFVSP
jgi:ATP-dependent Lhr-like helicase